jgi:hypothetical protein
VTVSSSGLQVEPSSRGSSSSISHPSMLTGRYFSAF